jgi:hypothetical protein
MVKNSASIGQRRRIEPAAQAAVAKRPQGFYRKIGKTKNREGGDRPPSGAVDGVFERFAGVFEIAADPFKGLAGSEQEAEH